MKEASTVIAALQTVAEVVDGSVASRPLADQTGLAEFNTIEKVCFEEMAKCLITNVLQRQKKKTKEKNWWLIWKMLKYV